MSKTAVVIRDVEYTYTARFAQTPQWNSELAAMYHALWMKHMWDDSTLQSAWDFDLPFRQVEVYDNDGSCILCMPLYRNEVGEWSGYNGTGQDVPLNELKYIECFSPNVQTMHRAVEVAKAHGVILDIPQMRSLNMHETVLTRLTRVLPYMHEGVPCFTIPACDPALYLDGSPSKKLRKNGRRAMRDFEKWGWTYRRSSMGHNDFLDVYLHWEMEVYEGERPIVDYYLHLFKWYDSIGALRVYRMADGEDNTVGFDVLINEGEYWSVIKTVYWTKYKSKQPGWFAMFGAMGMWALTSPTHRLINIGCQQYDADRYDGETDKSYDYKARWSTHSIPTFTFGLGNWEDREVQPAIPMGSFLHHVYCLMRICIQLQPDQDTAGLQESIDAQVGEWGGLQDGWDAQGHISDAWRRAHLGQHDPRGSEGERLYRFLTEGLEVDITQARNFTVP